MITTQKHSLFQQEWTGKGERGLRDFLLIPAIFFGAVSPGLYLSALFMNYTAGIWIALIMNFIGYGVTHLLFLGRMERFWRAMTNWKTSWISRGFVFNAFFMAVGTCYAVALTGWIPLLANPLIMKLLTAASALAAVLFAAYPGFMLSTVKAIPFWRSVLEPVIFFLQALLGGIALQLILSAVVPFDLSGITTLITFNFMLLLAVLLLILTALLLKARHGGIERESVEFLTTGDFSRVFLIGGLVLGLLLPLIILALGIIIPVDFEGHSLLYYGTMILELIGIYAAKYSILRAGAYSPIR